MHTTAIIQARMASSRLPGKVMLEIGDRPMLKWVVDRTHRAEQVKEVVIATTTNSSDDPVFEYSTQNNIPVFRGSVNDVLNRYYQTAKIFQADVIVRITADCPLIDPALIDHSLEMFFSETVPKDSDTKPVLRHFDFLANRLPPPWGRTFPIGLDIEIFTFQALEEAEERATSKHQREHVTPFFYEGTPADQLKYHNKYASYSSAITPQGYIIALLHHTPDYGYLRWTVDTLEDMTLVRKIVSYFPDDTFTWQAVLKLVQREPDLLKINAQVKHKTHLDVDLRNFDN